MNVTMRRAMAIVMTLSFILAGALPMVVPAGGSTTLINGRADLAVAPGVWENITTAETYDKVVVSAGAVLNIKKSGTLTAKDVALEGGSIIISGTLTIQGGPSGGECALHGYGPYMKINTDGKLQVIGPTAGGMIETSQGGLARVQFKADEYIDIRGQITASGYTGSDATSPWAMNGLDGYASAGGTVDIELETRMKEGSYITITGDISANGGSAGSAAGGYKQDGGGYSNGGLVGGHVGAGGDVNVTIRGYRIDMNGGEISVVGGRGGDAGNGASGLGQTGGGGGGYAGGGAVSSTSGNGVAVADKVGSGGSVNIDFFATTEAYFTGKTRITGTGGQGGNAGRGGNGGSGWGGGGGGGGGYGGGGGGTGTGNMPGESTTVIGDVARGGLVNFNFEAGDAFALSGETTLTLTGGRGGHQPATADGGGGFAGGTNGGGGGGGGYGGGGGGGGWNSAGGSTTVAGRVGHGGDVMIEFDEGSIAIGKNVEIFATGGAKGNGITGTGASGGSGAGGGQGAGKTTAIGKTKYQIPMVAPYLISPKEGSIVSSLPTFRWDPVHDTGPSPVVNVKEYILEVDDNKTFDTPEVFEEGLKGGSFKPTPMAGGKYYWRVKSKYGDAAAEIKTSVAKSFYYNKPPNLERGLPPIRINEDENKSHIMNLDEYFTDDLYPDTLEYGIVVESGVYHDIIMTLDGERNQWLNINLTDNYFGQEYFNISATDEGGLTGYSGTLSVIVLPVNDPPVITNLEDQLVTEDEETILFLSELLFDQESWNPLGAGNQPTYQVSHMEIRTDSDYIEVVKDPDAYPPTIDLMMLYTEGVGSERVNITVSDGFAQTTIPFIVNVSSVNDPPVLSEIPDIIVLEDTPKSINLNQYVFDEEDPTMDLTWKLRAQDRRLVDLELDEEANVLRIVPKPERTGQTLVYFTVADTQGSFASTEAMVKIQSVNDPPRFIVDHINIPKGIEYRVELLDIIVDVDSDAEDLEVITIEPVNGTDAVTLIGLGTAVFNYPDNDLTNDTLVVTLSDSINVSEQNITINLGYAPYFKKKVPTLIFKEDETPRFNLERYIEDADHNKSDLEWDVEGFDPSFIDPDVDGKLEIKAYKPGKANMTIIVTDPDGFQAVQVVKVQIEEVTFMTFLDRNPGILWGLILVIVLIILVPLLMFTSRRFGVPFSGMKEEKEEAETDVQEPPVTPDGSPPPPDGWVDGEGWSEEEDGPPPDGEGPPKDPTEGGPPSADAGPGPAPPPVKMGPPCVRCKEPVPEGANTCPACGTATDPNMRKRLRELRRSERHGDLTEEEEEELSRLEAQVEEGTSGAPPPAAPDSEAKSGDGPKCPSCGEEIEPDFIRCPACNHTLE